LKFELNFKSTRFNSTIGLRFDSIQFKFNSKEMDANWWRTYRKSAGEYGVEK
jgi:hypothetical protein